MLVFFNSFLLIAHISPEEKVIVKNVITKTFVLKSKNKCPKYYNGNKAKVLRGSFKGISILL